MLRRLEASPYAHWYAHYDHPIRDPHVVSLHYKLATAERVTFSARAVPVEVGTDAFRARLAGDALEVEMLDHHPGEESARAAVEPYLRSWEIGHALQVGGQPEITFEFVRAEVVDRDPPPPGARRTIELAALAGRVRTRAVGSASLSVERGSLPAPPVMFVADAEVQMLWARWLGYQGGQEPLQSMAYFALTVLTRHGGRPAAAGRFGVDQKVLSKLGHFVSERGNALTARKAGAATSPLTPAEEEWVKAAVLALIRRVGEVAADPTATPGRQLTMNDLPDL